MKTLPPAASHFRWFRRRPPRGRVLKIKLGYNPNSSSIGSLVSAFLWSASLGLIALNLLTFRLFRADPSSSPPADEPHEPPAPSA